MTVRYCGPGGADGNTGLSWAQRKETLNGVENTPVVAGDVCWIAPGVYRETLTVDVSGVAGSVITYVGDSTGENTDGVGGVVRITGSDDDQTATRASCVIASDKDYRVFRGFFIDSSSAYGISATDVENWIVEDCAFFHHADSGFSRGDGDGSLNITIRRCVFVNNQTRSVLFFDSTTEDNENHLVENCLMVASATQAQGVAVYRVGGIAVQNCTIVGAYRCVQVGAALSVGQTVTVNNCVLAASFGGVDAIAVGEIIEDYNTFFNNGTDRTNTNVGVHSVAYIPGLQPPLLNAGTNQSSGFKMPWWFGELSEWSPVRAIQGSNPPLVDLLGIERPHPDNRKSWGAVQFQDVERSTAQAHGGSASELHSRPGRKQFFVPSTNVSTTVSAWVYREANYRADRNPGFVLKQPGAADRVTRDAGAVAQWNQISDTFTPNALPPWFMIELVNENYYSTTTSTSTTSTSTTRTDTSTSTSTTTTSTSTSTTTLNVYFDDIIVN